MSSKEPAYKNTHRLAYRLLTAADEALYCDLYTNAEVMKYVAKPLTREKAAASFKKALALTQAQPFSRRITAIIERSSKEVIGISGVHLLDAKCRRAEVGSLLKSSAHTQGYGLEYSKALIAHVFKVRPVDELWAHAAKGHTAIETLLTTLGFRRGVENPATDGRPITHTWTIRRGSWKKHLKTSTRKAS